MTRSNHLPDASHNAAFRQRFPACVVENTENRMGPAEILTLFGRSWEDLCAAWTPVLIVWNPAVSDYGSSLYVLVHDAHHRFAEVHGSTSSMWAFEGCWSPEPVNEEAMRGILTRGWLRDDPANPLRALRVPAAAAMGLDIKAIDRRARAAQKLLDREAPAGASPRRPGGRR